MDNNLSFADFIAAAIRRGKQILVCMLVFTLLLGAFSAYRQISSSRSNADGQETAQQAYQEAVLQYENEKESLTTRLENAQNTLSAEQDYAINSQLMRVDPYNCYKTAISFTPTHLGVSQNNSGSTSLEYLTSQICSRYLLLWNDSSALSDLELSRLESIPQDTDPRYIRELITVSVVNTGTVSIVSRSNSASDSQLLANTVYNYFVAQQSTVGQSTAPHVITLLSNSTAPSVDSDLAKQQKDKADGITSSKKNIDDLKKSLSSLSEPTALSVGLSAASLIVSIVKYMIVGAVLGAFLGCAAVWLIDIFRGTAISSHQIERVTSLSYMGSLSKDKGRFTRCANKLLKERTWSDSEQAASYLLQQVKSQLTQGEKLLFVSSMEHKEPSALRRVMEQLQVDGILVSFASVPTRNPESLAALNACDQVVLAETAIRSTLPGISDTISLSRRAGKKVAGFILL